MKHLITKEIIALMNRRGWKVQVDVEKTPDERGRFLQTGLVRAKNADDLEVRINNETFISCYVRPAQIDSQLEAIQEKLNQNVELTELENAFYQANKPKSNREKSLNFLKQYGA